MAQTTPCKTQLDSAASFGRIGELKRLIERVEAPTREDVLGSVFPSYQLSTVGQACSTGNQGSLEMILRYVSPQILDRCATMDGQTPLMMAAGRADDGLVRMLLFYGADPCRMDCEGRTALDVSRVAAAPRAMDPTWTACYARCEHALMEAQRKRWRRQWQRAARLVAMLSGWQARAAERTYAPGGLGYDAASEEFGRVRAAAVVIGQSTVDSVGVGQGPSSPPSPAAETEADPAEVDPAEVDPAEVDPAEVDPAEVDPAEVDPAEVDPTLADVLRLGLCHRESDAFVLALVSRAMRDALYELSGAAGADGVRWWTPVSANGESLSRPALALPQPRSARTGPRPAHIDTRSSDLRPIVQKVAKHSCSIHICMRMRMPPAPLRSGTGRNLVYTRRCTTPLVAPDRA